MKKAEEYLDNFAEQFQFRKEGFVYLSLKNIIKQAQLDAIEYAVNKCEQNVELDYYDNINYNSIMKTIDQIKEELK